MVKSRGSVGEIVPKGVDVESFVPEGAGDGRKNVAGDSGNGGMTLTPICPH